MRFGFLLFNQFEDLDFVGPWEMIALWSKHYGGPEEVFTVSEKDGLVETAKGLLIKPHYNFSNCPPLDYLLVPGGSGTRTEINNPQLINFIKTQAINCQAILSVCTGAFLLQTAGLLQNKRATTHWRAVTDLKKFPEITVVAQRFVRDGEIWTSAGVSAGIDLALAFIAAMAGEEIAGKVQLHSEYYPLDKIYAHGQDKLPGYCNN